MPSTRGRAALSSFCAFALLAAAASSAQAAEPAAPDDAGIDLDQAVQVLKDEAIQFNRDAQMAEEEILYPPQSRLALYLSNSIPNLLLSDISVSIDGDAPRTHKYDETGARALLRKGALHRVALANVGRGAHRITLRYNGKIVTSKKDDEGEPVTGTFEAVFDKGLDAAEIELQIVRGVRKGTPGVKLTEWRAAE